MNNLIIKQTSKFKKDLKPYEYDYKVKQELFLCISYLQNNTPLPSKYKDYSLNGNYSGCRDCHIKPDVVLIYEIKNGYLTLIRIGKHNKLGLTEILKLHIKEN